MHKQNFQIYSYRKCSSLRATRGVSRVSCFLYFALSMWIITKHGLRMRDNARLSLCFRMDNKNVFGISCERTRLCWLFGSVTMAFNVLFVSWNVCTTRQSAIIHSDKNCGFLSLFLLFGIRVRLNSVRQMVFRVDSL